MIPALNLNELNKILKEKYKNKSKIVPIVLGRYNSSLTKKITNECYLYWHKNSGQDFDMFWAGYGEFLNETERTPSKIILEFDGNITNVFFDLDAFITIKNALGNQFDTEYNDQFSLLLLSYQNGRLQFNKSLLINLEENIDENYSTVRRLVEWLTNECQQTTDLQAIIRNFKMQTCFSKIKKINVGNALISFFSSLL